jgi:aspartate ammonia-lyase
MPTRRERDTLGEVAVPEDALYGAQTARAVENFPISGYKPFPAFIRATVLVKKAAALANAEAGRLPQDLAKAIVAACDEILAGKHHDQFVVDVFQAGAGTSHNMNANEVIANRANEILGAGKRGEYATVNPNDHVNMAQSTNDVTPTAIRLALLDLTTPVIAELEKLGEAFAAKAKEYGSVVKPGRTHLQDAVPITFGQELGGWASRMRTAAARLRAARVELSSIANDIRLMVSGPRTGFGELILPAVQPGSSIMPGKVNPSIAEMVDQVCYQVIGNDTAVMLGAQAGQLELNVMMPGMNFALCFSATILANATRVFRTKAIEGMKVDEARAKEHVDSSPPLTVTALAPHIGYARAAALVKRALAERRSLLDVALEEKVLPEADLKRVLDPLPMTKGGVQS